jgi:hypothetical protein
MASGANGLHPSEIGSLSVVVAPPCLDDDLGLGEAVEDLAVEQFVAKLRVEALTVAVLPRLPGSMTAVFAPTAAIHPRTALAMNSVPLSVIIRSRTNVAGHAA